VIAADTRQSPRGVFCDGINKILVPSALKQTAVVITGFITISEIPDNLPSSELCKNMADLAAESLRAFYGTELAQIIIGDFDTNSMTSRLLVFAAKLDALGGFQLQPVRIS
jgi:hypothetical protein